MQRSLLVKCRAHFKRLKSTGFLFFLFLLGSTCIFSAVVIKPSYSGSDHESLWTTVYAVRPMAAAGAASLHQPVLITAWHKKIQSTKLGKTCRTSTT